MDKQGALYFKLLTGVFLLISALWILGRLWSPEPAYQLYSTQICEVGDGITVSGFVVRSESLLFSRQALTTLSCQGQWIGAGQAFASTAAGSLVTAQGGYLSYEADGYEDLLTPDFLLSCKEDDFTSLMPESLPPHVVGRIVHDQNWYFAAPGNFPDLKSGDRVRLSIDGKQWPVTVLRTQGLLVLECSTRVHEILSLRQVTGELLLSQTEGIPLPKEAIYYEQGQTYVYLLQGAQAWAKVVHILRIEDDILWVAPTDLPSGARVILTETEITDGMVLT